MEQTQTAGTLRLKGRDTLASTILRVTDDDADTLEATCAEWCAENPEDAATFRQVALTGFELYTGGGAMPQYLVRRA